MPASRANIRDSGVTILVRLVDVLARRALVWAQRAVVLALRVNVPERLAKLLA